MEPERVIAALAKNCRVPAPAINGVLLDGLDPSRAFAFRRDPELVAYAGSVREVLARYGYAT
jgi:hypothetical protein